MNRIGRTVAVSGKRFATSHNLVVHGRVHSGEKPFNGHLCDKSFIRSSSLYMHSRVHTAEKSGQELSLIILFYQNYAKGLSTTCNITIVSGRAILSVENSGKGGNLWTVESPSRTRSGAWGAHSAPETPSWWGGGCCPSPITARPSVSQFWPQ